MHLEIGPADGAAPAGLGTVRFYADCEGDPSAVMDRAKEVLIAVDRESSQGWPSDEQWRSLLPKWFVDQCAPELSPAEVEALDREIRTTPYHLRTKFNEGNWRLRGWIHWFEPGNRHWYWWDAAPLRDGRLVVAVEVDGWPFPWASLSWLLRASGATRVYPEK